MELLHVDDDGGRGAYFPRFPREVQQVSISASASVAVSVPTGARYVIFGFEPGANVAVRANAAAVYPAGALADGSGALISPSQFNVEELVTLNFIAKSTATVVSLAFYK